jgi:hypothetical protein
MKRIATLLLVVAALALAQGEKKIVSFRLKKDPAAPQRGWMLEFTDEGFRFEQFGGGRKGFVKWDELVEEDARRLRVDLKLEMTEEERLGLIDGHEVFFKGGGSVRGVLEFVDEKGRHWVRNEGLVLHYPGDRIDRVEEIQLKEDQVFSEDEVYIRRLERTPPTSAKQHRDLAEHMFDIGNWEKAQEHYQRAIEMRSTLRPELEPRLAEIKDILEDEKAQLVFRKAKSRANLFGDYDGAVTMIEDYVAQFPGAKRRGLMIVEEIRVKRHAKLQALYHRYKADELDRGIRRTLTRRQPDLKEAMTWVTSQLPDQIGQRVRTRLNLTDDEYAAFQGTKAKGALHWATYKDGTFVISKRARVGKSSAKTKRGDPDEWWASNTDLSSRATFLKAYAVEKMPELFEVVQVRVTPCRTCGGTGTVRKASVNSVEGVGHQWKEICPRCFGAREDRAIGYR